MAGFGASPPSQEVSMNEAILWWSFAAAHFALLLIYLRWNHYHIR